MAKVPHRSEDELLDKLEKWMAALGRQPTLAELLASGDGELFAAYTLKVFRAAARKAVLDRLGRKAAELDRSPEQLGESVARVFAGLSNAWDLTSVEQLGLLGLTAEDDLHRTKTISDAGQPTAVIERVAILLNIFEAINILLPEPARADAWMRAPNTTPLFEGQTPLELMSQGLEQMRQVQQYLLAHRWGN